MVGLGGSQQICLYYMKRPSQTNTRKRNGHSRNLPSGVEIRGRSRNAARSPTRKHPISTHRATTGSFPNPPSPCSGSPTWGYRLGHAVLLASDSRSTGSGLSCRVVSIPSPERDGSRAERGKRERLCCPETSPSPPPARGTATAVPKLGKDLVPPAPQGDAGRRPCPAKAGSTGKPACPWRGSVDWWRGSFRDLA